MSGSPDVLIRGRTAVTVESSLGQGIYACPANENVGCPHGKEALGRWSVRRPSRPPSSSVSACSREPCWPESRCPPPARSASRPRARSRASTSIPANLKTPAAEPAHHDPGRQGRPDRHGLLPRPHGGRPQGHLAVHAEGDRRDRGLALLPARRDRPQGRPARAQPERAERRGRPGRLHAHPAVREERLRGGGRRRPGQGRPGHPADHRPQDPGTEVRDPGRGGAGQEEDPRELPQHHLLRRSRPTASRPPPSATSPSPPRT